MAELEFYYTTADDLSNPKHGRKYPEEEWKRCESDIRRLRVEGRSCPQIVEYLRIEKSFVTS